MFMPLIQTITCAAVLAGSVSATLSGGCHPAYSTGKTYAYGDWASVSTSVVHPTAFVECSLSGVKEYPDSGLRAEVEGGFSSSEVVYNYQCISPNEDTLLSCSNEEYAPGSMHSQHVWKRESSPCSTISFLGDIHRRDPPGCDDDSSRSDDVSTNEAHWSNSVIRSIGRKLQLTSTSEPTTSPPTSKPTTHSPTNSPTPTPTHSPTIPSVPTTPEPTSIPSPIPTSLPTPIPTTPTPTPNTPTTALPTRVPTPIPTAVPTSLPTQIPTPNFPSTAIPTRIPTQIPTNIPTQIPTQVPTPNVPSTQIPTQNPTPVPSPVPTSLPTQRPTATTHIPSPAPTPRPTPLALRLPTTLRPSRRTRRPSVTTKCTCPCGSSPSSHLTVTTITTTNAAKSVKATKSGKDRKLYPIDNVDHGNIRGLQCTCPCSSATLASIPRPIKPKKIKRKNRRGDGRYRRWKESHANLFE